MEVFIEGGGRLLQWGAVPPLQAASAPSHHTRLESTATLKPEEITGSVGEGGEDRRRTLHGQKYVDRYMMNR